MARLSHPNVITVHEVGHYGSRMYIAMELVDGGNVRQIVNVDGYEASERVGVYFGGCG